MKLTIQCLSQNGLCMRDRFASSSDFIFHIAPDPWWGWFNMEMLRVVIALKDKKVVRRFYFLCNVFVAGSDANCRSER